MNYFKNLLVENKIKIIISLVIVLTAFALGRYTKKDIVIETVKVVTKVEEVKTVEQEVLTKVVTVTVKEPSGVETTTSTATQSIATKIEENKVSASTATQSITHKPSSKVTASLLAGGSLTWPPKIEYGISVTKNLIGPVIGGVWVLTPGVVGVSVGLEF